NNSCYTSIYFVENQLSPSLISLSPLTESHPNPIQRIPVQSFSPSAFNLLTVRSQGFGCDWKNYTLITLILVVPPIHLLGLPFQSSCWPIIQKVGNLIYLLS